MKILTLSNSTNGPYGYSVLTKNLAREFTKMGHEVINFGNQTLGCIVKDEYGTPNLPIRFSTWYVDALQDYLITFKPDLVISFFDVVVAEGIQIAEMIREAGIPWILHATVNYSPTPIDLVDRCKRADVVVSPSKFGLRTLNESQIQNAVYIPHGIDPEKFNYEKGLKDKMKKSFGLEDKFVFLTVQRNRYPQKNMPQLFGTFQLFLSSNPEIKEKCVLLVLTDVLEPAAGVAGGGNPLLILRQMLSLEKNVMFVNQKIVLEDKNYVVKAAPESDPDAFYANANLALDENEMRKLYNLADCLVMSSLGESFGLPIIEGQACGLPAIAPKHTTMIELIQEPETGILCDILETQICANFSNVFLFSAFSMAGAMKKMYFDNKFLKKCGKNGIKNVKNYLWKNIAQENWGEFLTHFEKISAEVNYHTGKMGL